MVAHFIMRTYEVNQTFRLAEGIWLHRKSRKFFFGKDLFYIIRAQHVLSYHFISTMNSRDSVFLTPSRTSFHNHHTSYFVSSSIDD